MMTDKEFEDYKKNRYQDQVNWYSDKASTNKKYYQIFQWGVIILSAILPVLISALADEYKWMALSISVILAIGTTSLKTFKFQENWVNYRTISETLKKELHFFNASLDDYSSGENKRALFVDRVETLISRENSLWVTTHISTDEEKSKI